MSGNSGVSKSIYFTREEADWLSIEASDCGLSFKDLVKAKCAAKNNTIKVVRQFSLGHDTNVSLLSIAESLSYISRFYEAYAENDDIGDDQLMMVCQKHDEILGLFSDAINEMIKAVARSRHAD